MYQLFDKTGTTEFGFTKKSASNDFQSVILILFTLLWTTLQARMGSQGYFYPIIKEVCLTHLGGSMVKACISPNQAYMVLLKEAKMISDYRLISMVHSFFKLSPKCLLGGWRQCWIRM